MIITISFISFILHFRLTAMVNYFRWLCFNAIIAIMAVIITTNEGNTVLVFLSRNFTMEINE